VELLGDLKQALGVITRMPMGAMKAQTYGKFYNWYAVAGILSQLR
jgi:hypothetical protein